MRANRFVAETCTFGASSRASHDPGDAIEKQHIKASITRHVGHRGGAPTDPVVAGEYLQLLCERCLSKRPSFEMARAPAVFAPPIREAILKLKYGYRETLSEPLGKLMADYLKTDPFGPNKPDVLIPVPLHPSRFRERGFNQSASLAKVISRETGLNWSRSAMVRTRRTRPQASLKMNERERNVQGAFVVREATLIAGKRILLVDDVLTTLYTVTECSRVLMEAGAKSVWVLGVARDVLE